MWNCLIFYFLLISLTFLCSLTECLCCCNKVHSSAVNHSSVNWSLHQGPPLVPVRFPVMCTGRRLSDLTRGTKRVTYRAASSAASWANGILELPLNSLVWQNSAVPERKRWGVPTTFPRTPGRWSPLRTQSPAAGNPSWRTWDGPKHRLTVYTFKNVTQPLADLIQIQK